MKNHEKSTWNHEKPLDRGGGQGRNKQKRYKHFFVTHAESQLTWEGGRAGISNKNVINTFRHTQGVTTDLLDV